MSIGSHIIRRSDCFVSSMDWAKERLHDVPDGTLFLADRYHTARGRQGRTWTIFPGGIVLTFVLKPISKVVPYSPSGLHYLNMALAVGVVNGLRALTKGDALTKGGAFTKGDTLEVGIKWPNDFVIEHGVEGGALGRNLVKKVGGILTEVVWQATDGFHPQKSLAGSNPSPCFIVGIGINGNNSFMEGGPLELHATSLRDVLGAEVDLSLAQECVLASLREWYARWKQGDFEEIFSHWKDNQSYMNNPIMVHDHNGAVTRGVMKGVTPEGDLVLVGQHNNVVTIPFYSVGSISLDFR